MAGLLGEPLQKRALRTAVSVEEWVNGIQLARMFGGARRELVGRAAAQIILGV